MSGNKRIFFRQNFSLEVIKTEAKFVLSEQLWTRGEYRVFFFLIKSGQSKRWQTSTGVMLFIWESQRLYLQKKNKSPESGRWHFFHSARSISVPLFGGSAQINLALPPFPRAAARTPPAPPAAPFFVYALLYVSFSSLWLIRQHCRHCFFSPNPRDLIIMISKSRTLMLLG